MLFHHVPLAVPASMHNRVVGCRHPVVCRQQDPWANSFMPRHMRAGEWNSKQLRGLGAAP